MLCGSLLPYRYQSPPWAGSRPGFSRVTQLGRPSSNDGVHLGSSDKQLADDVNLAPSSLSGLHHLQPLVLTTTHALATASHHSVYTTISILCDTVSIDPTPFPHDNNAPPPSAVAASVSRTGLGERPPPSSSVTLHLCLSTHAPMMPQAGLKTIIALSFVLAVGFLLVILSCALWKVYYPLLVVGTYVLAPLPNWICGRCANPDDFVESSGNAVLDLGRFCTGFMVVMGIGMFRRSLSKWSYWHCTNERWYNSSTGRSRALEHDFSGRYGHVCCRGLVDLRNYHQLRHVLPGGVRLLTTSHANKRREIDQRLWRGESVALRKETGSPIMKQGYLNPAPYCVLFFYVTGLEVPAKRFILASEVFRVLGSRVVLFALVKVVGSGCQILHVDPYLSRYLAGVESLVD